MSAVIEVDDLRKTYDDVRAVDGISFAVEAGEFFGILGPNGAGKTTALEIIEGLRQADSGSVSLLGERPWPRNFALPPRVGVQLQSSAFFLTTHHMDEAEALCDRVAIMDHGQILGLDSPTALIRELDAPVRISVVRDSLADPATVPRVEDVTTNANSVILTTRQPADVLNHLAQHEALGGLLVHGATLEDVFLTLTGREYRA